MSFIKNKTLATKGYILWLDDNTKEYEFLSTISGKDMKVPNENLLIQSNRSEVGVLINKGLHNAKESKYIKFLPEGSIGVMCLPICLSRNRSRKERRKDTLTGTHKGYIYLETQSYLNKFDYDNLLLLNNLSSLICLNIDNYRLEHLSTTDKLTGVLTRKHFDCLLDDLIGNHDKYQGQFSLLMLDIDDFKNINDNYGHLKGDQVLSLLGKEIRANIRSTDIVARYGGEEFIFILFNTTIEDGMKIGQKIRNNIQKLRIPGIDRPITVSMGLAQYPEHSEFGNELIGKADQALYNAKETEGKNTLLSWTLDMGQEFKSTNKLAGIYTGNSVRDNANILAILDISKLVKSNESIGEKIYRFLGVLLDIIDGEYATILQVENEIVKSRKSRMRNMVGWSQTPILNESIVERVLKNKKGEFLIDWENTEDINKVSKVPNWQSVIVIPLIKNGSTKSIIYISTYLKKKEFNFEDLNLGELLSSIFVANLE